MLKSIGIQLGKTGELMMRDSSILPGDDERTQESRAPMPAGPHIWPSAELLHGFEAAGLSLWIWNVDDDSFTMDERGFRLSVVRTFGATCDVN